VRRHAPRAAIVVVMLCLAGAAAHAGVRDASSDALIHADASRALGYTGKGVTVAILDTGIDDNNPDLAGAVTAEHCIVPPDGCSDGTAEQDGPGSAQDDQGHGTAIADVIAGAARTTRSALLPTRRSWSSRSPTETAAPPRRRSSRG
jgi:subtilisin family serine protease